MPSLRDIKRRIKSVKNTRQITKAMKMVSAAKLKKAQDDITASRPYAEKMLEFVNALTSKTSAASHPLLTAREDVKKVGVVLLTSDRGLCGSFNAVMLRTIEGFLREHEDVKVALSLIGKRGMEYFKRREINVITSRPAGSGRPNYATAAAAAQELIKLFVNGELDEVYVIYSEFKSALSQSPVVYKLLPIAAIAPEKSIEAKGSGVDAVFEPEIPVIYEPSVAAVLSDILPRYVEVQVFRAFLDSSASEHGARMTAMDSASKNASEMIGALTLKYNRLRQAAITKELMEIIGGAEALRRRKVIFLEDVLAAYLKLEDEDAGRVRVTVESSFDLSPAAVEEIKKKLKEATGKEVVAVISRNPAVIGGLVIKMGGTVMDLSIKGQLKRIKQKIAEGVT